MSTPPPMKETDLRKHTTCSLCSRKILHAGVPLFWIVTVNRYGVRLDRAQRQDGLAAFLGSSALANVMGANEDLAEPVMDTVTLSLCESCATTRNPLPIAAMIEGAR